jgi:predicted signal transduction protein with EAL and GGDEF domain
LLIEVASRLMQAVRDEDLVYRFAGDEFVVLTHGVGDDGQAVAVADRLREAVTQPTTLEGQAVSVGCSVGVVRASTSATAEELVRDADVAMYRAKRNGKGAVALFDLSVRAEIDRHLEIVARVRTALDEQALTVGYRLELDIATSSPVAVDLSLRLPDHWDDVSMEEVRDAIAQSKSDAKLIAFLVARGAEDLTLIRESISDCRASIGVTPAQLRTPGLVDQIARALLSTGLGSRDLELRIPDEAWSPGEPELASVVAELASLGVGIALEDVGIARTNLRELGHPSIGGLRLSSGLLGDESPAGRAAIGAIVHVADQLGLSLSASIQSPTQLELVRELGVGRVLDSSSNPISLAQLLDRPPR